MLVSELAVRLNSGVVRRLVVRAAGAPLAGTLVGKTIAQMCTQLYAAHAHPTFCDCAGCLEDDANEQALEDQTQRQWEDWQDRPEMIA